MLSISSRRIREPSWRFTNPWRFLSRRPSLSRCHKGWARAAKPAGQLKAAAAASERSVGEELELRIDQSFLSESPVEKLDSIDTRYVIAHMDNRWNKHQSLVAENFETLYQVCENASLEVAQYLKIKIEFLKAFNSSLTENGSVRFNDPRIREIEPLLDIVDRVHATFANARADAQGVVQQIAIHSKKA